MTRTSIRLKVDENLPQEVCRLLRDSGHDALSVNDQGMTGADDERLAHAVQVEKRGILTQDVGVGNIGR